MARRAGGSRRRRGTGRAARAPRRARRARRSLATLAGRDEVAALRERLDGFRARRLAVSRERRGARAHEICTLAGRDEVDALRERLDEVGGLRRRVDEALPSGSRRSIAARAPCSPTCATIARAGRRRGDRGARRASGRRRRRRGRERGARGRRARGRGSRRDAARGRGAGRAHGAAQRPGHGRAQRRVRGAGGDRGPRLAARRDRSARRGAARASWTPSAAQVDRLGGTVVDTGVALQAARSAACATGSTPLRAELVAPSARRPSAATTASRRCSPSCTYALKSLEELKQGLSLRRPGGRDRAPRGRAGAQGRAARRLDRARHGGLPADPRPGRAAQRADAPPAAGHAGAHRAPRARAGQARGAPRLRRRARPDGRSSPSTASSRSSTRRSRSSWATRSTSS